MSDVVIYPIKKEVLFALGTLMITDGAAAAIQATGEPPRTFLHRHERGDWGDVPPEDIDANQQSLRDGSPLYSWYTLADATRILIITDGDRACTTIMLAEEY